MTRHPEYSSYLIPSSIYPGCFRHLLEGLQSITTEDEIGSTGNIGSIRMIHCDFYNGILAVAQGWNMGLIP